MQKVSKLKFKSCLKLKKKKKKLKKEYETLKLQYIKQQGGS